MTDRTGGLGDLLTTGADDFPVGELFDSATNAIVIANEATGSIVEINPAALHLLGATRTELVGHNWQQALGERRVAGRQPFAATASTFRVAKNAYLLVRLVPDEPVAASASSNPVDVFARLDAISSCFVLTNGELCIEFANQAFLQLVHQAGNEQVAGQSLLRWLSLSQADLARMRAQMLSREACGVLTSKLRDGPGRGLMVEIMAIAAPDDTNPHWGFILHRAVAH